MGYDSSVSEETISEEGWSVYIVNALTITGADNMAALEISAIGMGVVFAVLGSLWLMLILLHKLFGEEPTGSEAEPTTTVTEPIVPTTETAAAPMDARIPAMITAAVIHSLGRVPQSLEIRRAGKASIDRRRTTAVMAAALTQLDESPGRIDVRKV